MKCKSEYVSHIELYLTQEEFTIFKDALEFWHENSGCDNIDPAAILIADILDAL